MPVKRLAALGLLFTLATSAAFACTKAPPPQPAAFDAAAGNAEPASSSSSTPAGAVCVVDTDKMKAAMAAVGGSGTGLAQDATVQQIIKLYGASIPQGGSGTGLCQDASLQALYLLIAAQLDAGSGSGSTVATVNAANTPYTALPTDSLIEMVSGTNGGPVDTLVTVKFEAAPNTGQRHTVKWWSYSMAAGGPVPPAVNGNGKQVEAYTSNGVTGLGATTNITTPGNAVTWEYDGTQWVLVA